MIAGAVSLHYYALWTRLLKTAEELGAEVSERWEGIVGIDADEIVIYTGRTRHGAWIVH